VEEGSACVPPAVIEGLLFKLVPMDVAFCWIEVIALWTDAVAEARKLLMVLFFPDANK
jgi:hypothetical protein